MFLITALRRRHLDRARSPASRSCSTASRSSVSPHNTPSPSTTSPYPAAFALTLSVVPSGLSPPPGGRWGETHVYSPPRHPHPAAVRIYVTAIISASHLATSCERRPASRLSRARVFDNTTNCGGEGGGRFALQADEIKTASRGTTSWQAGRGAVTAAGSNSHSVANLITAAVAAYVSPITTVRLNAI